MVIASLNHPYIENGWTLSPRTRYVLSHPCWHRIEAALLKSEKREWLGTYSAFNSYERRYAAQDLNGRQLAIYRESGLGDNLIITGLTHFLKKLYPKSGICSYGLPQAKDAWLYNEDCFFLGQPMTFDGLRRTDYHYLLEGMFETDSEPEQPNCYDTIFAYAGFDPKLIPDECKRPKLFHGAYDEDADKSWSEAKPSKYVAWHWCPSGMNRQYPFELSEKAIRIIADSVDVVIIGDGGPHIPRPDIDHPRVHSYYGTTQRWRQLIPTVKMASAVIAPDSSIVHLTGCFPDVPCFGLWGSFSPESRALYYPNHIALKPPKDSCYFSPCFAQYSDLPRAKCAAAKGYTEETKFCTALSSIPFELIAETVVKSVT